MILAQKNKFFNRPGEKFLIFLEIYTIMFLNLKRSYLSMKGVDFSGPGAFGADSKRTRAFYSRPAAGRCLCH